MSGRSASVCGWVGLSESAPACVCVKVQTHTQHTEQMYTYIPPFPQHQESISCFLSAAAQVPYNTSFRRAHSHRNIHTLTHTHTQHTHNTHTHTHTRDTKTLKDIHTDACTYKIQLCFIAISAVHGKLNSPCSLQR